MTRSSWWVVLAAAALLAGAVRSETPSAGGGDSPRQPSSRPPSGGPGAGRPMFAPGGVANARRLEPHERDERRFLRGGAAGSRLQVEAARLVLARSANAGVRSLATTLATHHAAAVEDLLRLLHQRGMAAPMLENQQRRVLTRLARLQGGKLDREYLDEVAVAAQRALLDDYQKASLAVRDPGLRDWIERALPALRHHLASAERLAGASRPAAPPAPAPGRRHGAPPRPLSSSGSQ